MGTCKQCQHFTECSGDAAIEGFEFDPDFDGQHGCTGFDPFTNADRLRAMNDEELADFIAGKFAIESYFRLVNEGYNPTETEYRLLHENQYLTWIRWLKQTAEEG